MLTFAVVQEIRRLLAEGELGQRKIAEKLGVSRGSVSQVLQGKHCSAARRDRRGALPPGRPGHRNTVARAAAWFTCRAGCATFGPCRPRSGPGRPLMQRSCWRPRLDLPLPEIEIDPRDDLTPLLEEAERLRYKEIRFRPEPGEEPLGERAARRNPGKGPAGPWHSLAGLENEAPAAAADEQQPLLSYVQRMLPRNPLENVL